MCHVRAQHAEVTEIRTHARTHTHRRKNARNAPQRTAAHGSARHTGATYKHTDRCCRVQNCTQLIGRTRNAKLHKHVLTSTHRQARHTHAPAHAHTRTHTHTHTRTHTCTPTRQPHGLMRCSGHTRTCMRVSVGSTRAPAPAPHPHRTRAAPAPHIRPYHRRGVYDTRACGRARR